MPGLLPTTSELSKKQCRSHRFTTDQILLNQAAKQQKTHPNHPNVGFTFPHTIGLHFIPRSVHLLASICSDREFLYKQNSNLLSNLSLKNNLKIKIKISILSKGKERNFKLGLVQFRIKSILKQQQKSNAKRETLKSLRLLFQNLVQCFSQLTSFCQGKQ